MILTLIAAPLIAAGRPGAALSAMGTRHFNISFNTIGPMTAALNFAVLLWFWHAPGPYGLTFRCTAAYWTMHATVLASAILLWTMLVDATGARVGPGILAGVFSSVQMGLLGALITLSPRAIYAPHWMTTAAWGLTPLEDQQLGGAIMWVPGCVVFLTVAMVTLWRVLSVQPVTRTEIAAA